MDSFSLFDSHGFHFDSFNRCIVVASSTAFLFSFRRGRNLCREFEVFDFPRQFGVFLQMYVEKWLLYKRVSGGLCSADTNE